MVSCIGGDIQIELSRSLSHCPVFGRVEDPAIPSGFFQSPVFENFGSGLSEEYEPDPKKTVVIIFQTSINFSKN